MVFDLFTSCPHFICSMLDLFFFLLSYTKFNIKAIEKYKNDAENQPAEEDRQLKHQIKSHQEKCRINTLTEYRKVLNTVPTLGGVKSGFHEAKQESIINYESDYNRQSMMTL